MTRAALTGSSATLARTQPQPRHQPASSLPHPRVALVTGASRGIGKAIAVALAAEGYSIAVNYRHNKAAADATVEQIRSERGKAHAFQLDVGELEKLPTLMDGMTNILGASPVVLINNAGLHSRQHFGQLSREAFDRTMKVHAYAPLRLSQLCLPYMCDHNWGRIINISSVYAHRAAPGQVDYSMAKAALGALTRSIAVEYGLLGIRANTIIAGLIRTDSTRAEMGDGTKDHWLQQIPQGEFGDASQVADAVRYLVCDGSTYINGGEFHVDGGLSVRI